MLLVPTLWMLGASWFAWRGRLPEVLPSAQSEALAKHQIGYCLLLTLTLPVRWCSSLLVDNDCSTGVPLSFMTG